MSSNSQPAWGGQSPGRSTSKVGHLLDDLLYLLRAFSVRESLGVMPGLAVRGVPMGMPTLALKSCLALGVTGLHALPGLASISLFSPRSSLLLGVATLFISCWPVHNIGSDARTCQSIL